MRWCFGDGSTGDLAYAERVMDSLVTAPASVPLIWKLEVTNVLVRGERLRVITANQSTAFLATLRNLPIIIDVEGIERAWSDTLNLARKHRLSAYDAAYLELAMRKQLPLATLDADLRKAAKRAGTIIF